MNDPTLKLIKIPPENINFPLEIEKLFYDTNVQTKEGLTFNPINILSINPYTNLDLEQISPFEKLGTSIFGSKTSIILANIDAIFNIINRQGGELGHQELKEFSLLEISSDRNPGYITRYLQYRLPFVASWIITNNFDLIPRSDLNMTKINLYKSQERDKISPDILALNPFGIDLIVSDDCNLQNINLKILKTGGNLIARICKIIPEELYNLVNSFDKFALFKPISSPCYLPDMYAICLSKLSKAPNFTFIPSSFINYLNANMYNPNPYIAVGLAYLEGKKITISEYNLNRALILFNIPGNREFKVKNKVNSLINSTPSIIPSDYIPSDPTLKLVNPIAEGLQNPPTILPKIKMVISPPSSPRSTNNNIPKRPLSPGKSDITSSVELMRNTIQPINS